MCFDFYFQFGEELYLWMFYKNTVKGQIIEDDVRDEMIFNFNKFFEKHHIAANNAMENCWEITFDNFYYTIKDVEDAIENVKKILLKAGATYNKEMANDMQEDNELEAFNIERIYMPETEAKILRKKMDTF